jgi:hypothetical protein
VRKKPVPFLDHPIAPSAPDGLVLSTINNSFSAGNSSLLGPQGTSGSDQPYSPNLLIEVSPPGSPRPGASFNSTPSSAIATNVEKASDPFADPDDPFADPKKETRLSSHSESTGLSYESYITAPQSDQSPDPAGLGAKHVSMQSGLSYASLTSSQAQRRINYVGPSASDSDTSSERRLSSQSGASIASANSVGTVRPTVSTNDEVVVPDSRSSTATSVSLNVSTATLI